MTNTSVQVISKLLLQAILIFQVKKKRKHCAYLMHLCKETKQYIFAQIKRGLGLETSIKEASAILAAIGGSLAGIGFIVVYAMLKYFSSEENKKWKK